MVYTLGVPARRRDSTFERAGAGWHSRRFLPTNPAPPSCANVRTELSFIDTMTPWISLTVMAAGNSRTQEFSVLDMTDPASWKKMRMEPRYRMNQRNARMVSRLGESKSSNTVSGFTSIRRSGALRAAMNPGRGDHYVAVYRAPLFDQYELLRVCKSCRGRTPIDPKTAEIGAG